MPPGPGKMASMAVSVSGAERDVEGAQRGAVELGHRAGADDRARDAVLREEPRQGDGGRLLTEVGAQLLPLLQLRAQLVDALQRLRRLAARAVGVAEHTAEQPARQRAPRDHADAVLAARRQHLELDGAHQQVVVALLADEAERVNTGGGLVGADDVPAGEVAAADVGDLALLRSACPSPATPPPTARCGRRGASGRGRCGRSASAAGCRRTPSGCDGPTVVRRWATPTSPRTASSPARPSRAGPPPCANQRPMIDSVAPTPLSPP